MFLIYIGMHRALGHPFVDACLGKADEGHRLLQTFEHTLGHLELVQVAASQERAPFVSTVEPFE